MWTNEHGIYQEFLRSPRQAWRKGENNFAKNKGSLESTVESPFLKKLSFHQKMELTVESPVLSSATTLESGVEFPAPEEANIG
ncbi:hypothetical protein [Geoalkalibacter subterraneus]|uniref:hypothetical protein n=1 Tax=Geoalkalibacter subterraneus TaxID=483547 RepID=UPI001184FB02|nr:hypothetical protein [Geoalkalibacter subterraneus]